MAGPVLGTMVGETEVTQVNTAPVFLGDEAYRPVWEADRNRPGNRSLQVAVQ